MKRQDLLENRRRARRAGSWFFLTVLALALLLGLLASLPSFAWIKTLLSAEDSRQPMPVDALLVLFLVAVTAGMLFISWRYDMRCPHCGKSIHGGVYTPIAITTGRCGHCGERILED